MSGGASPERPHVLVVHFSGSGHLNPLVGVARELERRGAVVTMFSCQDDVTARVRRAGLRARCLAAAEAPSSIAARGDATTPASIALTRRMKQPAWLRRWISHVLIDAVPAQVERLAAAVAESEPDLLCVDSQAYAGAIVATQAGIPWAAISTGLHPLSPPGWTSPAADVFQQLAEHRDRLGQRYGMSLRYAMSDVVSPWLNTVFSVEELSPRTADNDFSLFVGSTPGGERGDEPELAGGWHDDRRPLVYISFGSVLSPEIETYQQLMRMFGPDEAQVLIVAKDLLGHPAFAAPPPHVRVVAYAPQLRVLERAAVMLTHGGFNSVMECLTAGKPMLVVPLAYDQPLNAQYVVHSGAGHALAASEVSAESCGDVLRAIMRDDAPERAQARRLASACRRTDGGCRAAELMLELASSRQPLNPRARFS